MRPFGGSTTSDVCRCGVPRSPQWPGGPVPAPVRTASAVGRVATNSSSSCAACRRACAARAASSSSVSCDLSPRVAGRSSGTPIIPVPGQTPCRSGSPQAVRGTTERDWAVSAVTRQDVKTSATRPAANLVALAYLCILCYNYKRRFVNRSRNSRLSISRFGGLRMADPIRYATTVEGTRLPIVDVTHPAFAVAVTDAELDALCERYLLASRGGSQVSPQVVDALRRSQLGRGLMAASGTYLSGIATYLLKLGPDNLPAGADEIDRRIAASLPGLTTRLRVQDVARLLADGLTPMLRDGRDRPLALVNLAAGVIADSWNALIMLRVAGLLEQRAVSIVALDPDEAGPAFGKRALEALGAHGAPLDGVAVAFRHEPYDWSDTRPLLAILRDVRPDAL